MGHNILQWDRIRKNITRKKRIQIMGDVVQNGDESHSNESIFTHAIKPLMGVYINESVKNV